MSGIRKLKETITKLIPTIEEASWPKELSAVCLTLLPQLQRVLDTTQAHLLDDSDANVLYGNLHATLSSLTEIYATLSRNTTRIEQLTQFTDALDMIKSTVLIPVVMKLLSIGYALRSRSARLMDTNSATSTVSVPPSFAPDAARSFKRGVERLKLKYYAYREACVLDLVALKQVQLYGALQDDAFVVTDMLRVYKESSGGETEDTKSLYTRLILISNNLARYKANAKASTLKRNLAYAIFEYPGPGNVLKSNEIPILPGELLTNVSDMTGKYHEYYQATKADGRTGHVGKAFVVLILDKLACESRDNFWKDGLL